MMPDYIREMMKNKSSRGGARAGAGRPSSNKTPINKRVTIVVKA
jgi:hypothetical protein